MTWRGGGGAAALLLLLSSEAYAQSPPATPTLAATRPVPATSIYGGAARPRQVAIAPPAGPLDAPASALQGGGLPTVALVRQTDASPTCRSTCAAHWYACGPGAGDCNIARTACVAGCAHHSTKFGEFAASPR